MSRRVVVTGMSGVTSLGDNWDDIRTRMSKGETGIRYMSDWERYEDMSTRLAGPVEDFKMPSHFSRKALRSMGPVSRMAVAATEKALEDAGLLEDKDFLQSGRIGTSYGSSFGSTAPVKAFARLMETGQARGLTATSYIQMMSHTAPVNIGVHFGLTGRIIPTSSACTSGSMGVGYAYEAIKAGHQDAMIAGGAEELCPTMAAVFDTLFATSQRNDEPHLSPRPYDAARDGLVIGEGSATLILEEREHAIARGATIHAEILGFGTNSDGKHITQPSSDTMRVALELALKDSGIDKSDIDLINGHGTATAQGDVAECQATYGLFDRAVPFHTLKGYFGHTLGACGSIELWLAIKSMHDGWVPPTANLTDIDENCAGLDHIKDGPRDIEINHFMSNNFAFGGINTSLIIGRGDN
ncbi:beta-ketoacyl-ACP synthase [Sneathiella sp. P13V-1]|uniref:beta-ketoacyl-ACP synthase n=1 Tax=Sneathiella sp. P13V-1 TaxID=2697366 RepID=UPI00187B702F|nr:beta-ketoacyl-ACP synthase [Sneathiella sp. P13V-1]MBE7636508.1 beta-ketoacyl-ACP synthase [Sneathiella sp. P13V-1]